MRNTDELAKKVKVLTDLDLRERNLEKLDAYNLNVEKFNEVMTSIIVIEIERSQILGIPQFLLNNNLQWYRLDSDGTKTYLNKGITRRLQI